MLNGQRLCLPLRQWPPEGRAVSHCRMGLPEGKVVSPSEWGSLRAGLCLFSERGSPKAGLGSLSDWGLQGQGCFHLRLGFPEVKAVSFSHMGLAEVRDASPPQTWAS